MNSCELEIATKLFRYEAKMPLNVVQGPGFRNPKNVRHVLSTERHLTKRLPCVRLEKSIVVSRNRQWSRNAGCVCDAVHGCGMSTVGDNEQLKNYLCSDTYCQSRQRGELYPLEGKLLAT